MGGSGDPVPPRRAPPPIIGPGRVAQQPREPAAPPPGPGDGPAPASTN